MFNLYSINNTVYIFKLDDFEELRRKYRIIGKISGVSLSNISLPIVLLPEEVYLLVIKNLAKVVTLPDLLKDPTEEAEKIFQEYTLTLFHQEAEIYKEKRKKELEKIIDQVVKGKHSKNQEVKLSKKEIFEQELNKSGSISKENMLWSIPTEHYDCLRGCKENVNLNDILKTTTEEKCKIFADLWEKGYYITSANKFGGDFLVYLGDPVAFHAIFIVHCVSESHVFHPCEIIALGRLSTSVKKKAVFATLKPNNDIDYLTLSWFDSQ